MTKGRSRKPWRKVLYEDQGVPDNYVDPTFLREMRKNLFLREYDYWSVVLSTGCITQQANAVLIFVMCFIYLRGEIIDYSMLNAISVAVLFLGYSFTVVTKYAAFDLKALIIFCTAAFVLSSVLMSLTETISTDTIQAMTTVMLLVHLVTHGYDLEALPDGVVSFNAGIFATVCLASRLQTLAQGYSLMVLSVLIFGMLPNLRQHMRTYFAPYVDIAMTCSYFILAFGMIWSQAITLAVLQLLMFVFVTFVCPYLLISLQPLKNNVYGPWDEAVVAET